MEKIKRVLKAKIIQGEDGNWHILTLYGDKPETISRNIFSRQEAENNFRSILKRQKVNVVTKSK